MWVQLLPCLCKRRTDINADSSVLTQVCLEVYKSRPYLPRQEDHEGVLLLAHVQRACECPPRRLPLACLAHACWMQQMKSLLGACGNAPGDSCGCGRFFSVGVPTLSSRGMCSRMLPACAVRLGSMAAPLAAVPGLQRGAPSVALAAARMSAHLLCLADACCYSARRACSVCLTPTLAVRGHAYAETDSFCIVLRMGESWGV